MSILGGQDISKIGTKTQSIVDTAVSSLSSDISSVSSGVTSLQSAISTQTTSIKSGLKKKFFVSTITAGSSLTISTGGQLLGFLSTVGSGASYVKITIDSVDMTPSSYYTTYGMPLGNYSNSGYCQLSCGNSSATVVYGILASTSESSVTAGALSAGNPIEFNTATITAAGNGLKVLYLKYV